VYLSLELPLSPEIKRWKARGGSGKGGPVSGCDDSKGLSELKHSLCLAPRREHVVGEMKFVVFPPVVWSKKRLNMTPRTLDGVSTISGVTTAGVTLQINPRVLQKLDTDSRVTEQKREEFYSHHRTFPANLADTMFSGRTASRAVYPVTPL
jgi:hypothetical protein